MLTHAARAAATCKAAKFSGISGGRARRARIDGRCASTILRSVITLCSRSRCGAREAMTVGCKPTTREGLWLEQSDNKAWGPQASSEDLTRPNSRALQPFARALSDVRVVGCQAQLPRSGTPVLNHTPVGKLKIIIDYFRTFKIGFDVFFDADSESPHMT